MPKEFRCTMKVNVFIVADSQEEADSKFEDMDIEFHDPDSGDLLQSELIDWKINDVGDIEDDYERDFDED